MGFPNHATVVEVHVVVDDEYIIGGAPNIEIDSSDAELDCPLKGFESVLPDT
jgi:hypothetical protein